MTATVLAPGLEIDGTLVDWLDIDTVTEGDHRVTLGLASGSPITLSMLGATHDRFLAELRTARRRARYAALTIATGEPLVSYLSRAAGGLVDVHLFDKVLVAEPRNGGLLSASGAGSGAAPGVGSSVGSGAASGAAPGVGSSAGSSAAPGVGSGAGPGGAPVAVPLSLITAVDRDGYTVTVGARGIDPLVVTALGVKTDEFCMRLAQARRDLLLATTAAYAQFDAALEGFDAPDGWAVDAAGAGASWGALLDRALAGSRAEQVRTLAELSGDALRIGIFTDGGTAPLPFVLAPVGDFVVVEATDGDDRATFVFRVAGGGVGGAVGGAAGRNENGSVRAGVDRLNAVLLLTSFRREALFLADDKLGRWAVAVRTWPAVREARAALVARVVHDEQWDAKIRAAVGR